MLEWRWHLVFGALLQEDLANFELKATLSDTGLGWAVRTLSNFDNARLNFCIQGLNLNYK